MTVLVIIFSYNRLDTLKETINTARYTPREGEDIEVVILDDGSEFDLELESFVKLPHTGKRGFYKKWADAFHIIERTQPDMIVFMPDDFTHAKLNKMVSIHKQMDKEPYCFNIINDGRDICWTGVKPGVIGKIQGVEYRKIGFVDCGFFCNLSVIEKLRYMIFEVTDAWFNDKAKSSGVGYQLSRRLVQLGVPMFKPIKSLAKHGEHESVMHTEERKVNPLISK